MKKYEIEFAIVIVLLSIVVAIQAMLTEPCRQKQPMQINVYDRGSTNEGVMDTDRHACRLPAGRSNGRSKRCSGSR